MSEVERLTLRNQLGDLGRLSRFLDGYGSRHGLDTATLHRVTLVLEELLTNTIAYGYPSRQPQTIDLSLSRRDHHLEVTIDDDAWPFDPRLRGDAALAQTLEHRAIGGVGLYLIGSLSDAIDYRQQDGRNRTHLRFVLPHAEA